MKTIDNLTNEELIQMLANAEKTFSDCNGHTKAYMNKGKIVAYRAALNARSAKIPSRFELYSIGIFNGDGAG